MFKADYNQNIFRKIPLSLKILAPLFMVLLFLSFQEDQKANFIELAAVEVVHAEDSRYNSDSESIVEKEKLLSEMIATVKEREKTLDTREKELDVRYENLNAVKRDIEERLESLKLLRAGIQKDIELQKSISDEIINKQNSIIDANITKLAKVYEATAPAQAGPLLSTIDIDIAAKILMKMNNMKAGKIWGYVEPKRAAQISKKIAQYNSTNKK